MDAPPGYSPLVARTDDPTKLARHAIRLLESELNETFGLRAVMGAELEFTLTSPKIHNFGGLSLFSSLPDRTEKPPGHAPSADRRICEKDLFFPESPYITYSYREIAQPDSAEQYEIVISHEARYRDLNHFADVINATRGQLRVDARPPGFIRTERSEGTAAAFGLRRAERQIKAANIDQVSFLGTHGKDTNGLHLNLSLTPAKNAPIHAHQLWPDKKERNTILRNTQYFMRSNIDLFCPNPESIDRLCTRGNAKQVRLMPDEKSGLCMKPYLENALFSADANAHFAVLVQLAAAYDAIERGTSYGDRLDQKLYQGDMEAEKRRDRFTSDKNPLRTVLNDLESGLGDRFINAVLAHPQSRGMPDPVRETIYIG